MGQIIFLIILTIFVLSIRYLYRLASAPGIFTTIIFSLVGAFMVAKGFERIAYHHKINHSFQAIACKIEKLIPDEGNSVNRAASRDANVYSFRIGDDKHMSNFFCPSVLFSYTISNQTYQKAIQLNCATDEAGQKQLLSGYPEGGSVACFYNPDNYGDIIFERDEVSLFWYLFASFGALIFGYVNYRYNYPLQPASGSLLSSLVKAGTQISNSADAVKLKDDIISRFKNQNTPHENVTSADGSNNKGNPFTTKRPTSAKDALFIAFITTIMFACTYYMVSKDMRANYGFKQTTCNIVDKKMATSTSDGKIMYSASFHVEYNVDNKNYSQWISPGIFATQSNISSFAQSTLDKYEINKQYYCWYDPDQPGVAILERGFSIFSYIFSFLTILLIWGLVKMLMNLKNNTENTPNRRF